MILPLISPRFTYSRTVRVLRRRTSAVSRKVRSRSPMAGFTAFSFGVVIAPCPLFPTVRDTRGIPRRTSAGESSCRRPRHSIRHSAVTRTRPVSHPGEGWLGSQTHVLAQERSESRDRDTHLALREPSPPARRLLYPFLPTSLLKCSLSVTPSQANVYTASKSFPIRHSCECVTQYKTVQSPIVTGGVTVVTAVGPDSG
jgi:hypothetical protein